MLLIENGLLRQTFICSYGSTIAPSVQHTHIFPLGVCDQSVFLLFVSGKALAHFFLVNHILIVSFPTEVSEVDLGICGL